MQREFLKDLGLEKDVIEKIMAENGKDIQAEQEKAQTTLDETVKQLTDDLDEAQKTIEKMESTASNADEVQKQADEYKQKYEAEAAKRKESERLNAIEKALIANRANDKYLDTLVGYIPGDVDLDKIDDEVAKIKEEYSELFQVANTQEAQSNGGYKVLDNRLKDGQAVKMTKEQILAIKDNAERQKKIAENLELFR